MRLPSAYVVDARDPPLGATERVLATVAARDVLRGLGIAALASPRAKLTVETDDEGAREALRREAERLGATIAIGQSRAARGEVRLRPSALVEVAWRERAPSPAHVLTIAGAVELARVLLAKPTSTVGELVASAGPHTPAWVALWGGATGALVDRSASVAELVAEDRARLLLVLPAGHGLVRRARTPMASWLRRAQSACASCGMCAPACPEGVPAPDVLRALVHGGPALRGNGARSPKLTTATACTGCGACDLLCPQALSPARIVGALGRDLRAAGVAPPRPVTRRTATPLEEGRALARLGLARYARAVSLDIVPS